jgi:predicted HicB family RNase H-like nuclease
VRIPRSLHRDLVRRAAEEGVSLNQFATVALARAVGWSAPRKS